MPTTLGCTKRCYARRSGNVPEIYQKTKVIRVSDDLFLPLKRTHGRGKISRKQEKIRRKRRGISTYKNWGKKWSKLLFLSVLYAIFAPYSCILQRGAKTEEIPY